ncbi:MAG: InlB B-repeat-containing protein [Acholeplasma sp.]|nr:InlB B-repeat-containing protein [Acholeplasma sp.]
MKKLGSLFSILVLALVLVACTAMTFTVSFESNGGPKIPPVTVEDGKTLTAPTTPTKSGYSFEGWYKDVNLTELWKFETDVVTKDITLYAKWTELGPTDVEIVDSVFEWLSLGDISALTNQSPRLIMPTSRDGVTISWTIDKPKYIQTNGLIVQPEAEIGDQSISLVATLTLNQQTKTKTFTATVIALPAVNESPNLIEEYFDYENGLIGNSTTPWAPVSGKTGTSLFTVVDAISELELPGDGKALKVEAFTETQLEAAIPHSYNVIVIETYVMQTVSSNGSAVHIQSSASSPVIGFGLDGTSLYYRVDNVQHKNATVEINQWYKIRLEVDLNNKTIEMFYYESNGQLIPVTPGKVSFIGTVDMSKLFLRTGSSTTNALRDPAYVTGIVANRIEAMERPSEIVGIGEISGIDGALTLEAGSVFTPQEPVVLNKFGNLRPLVKETDYIVSVTHEVDVNVPNDYTVTFTITNKTNSADKMVVEQTVTVFSAEQPNVINEVTSTVLKYQETTIDVTVTVLQAEGDLYYLLSDNETETAASIKAGAKVLITQTNVTISDLVLYGKTYIHMIVVLNGDSNTVHHKLTYETVTEVSTAEQLVEIIENGATGAIILTSNIDMTGQTLIGSKEAFGGTFDGQGHTISNAVINADTNKKGFLFGKVLEGAVVKNVVFADSIHNGGGNSESAAFVSAFAQAGSTFENIEFYNVSVIHGGSYAALMFGDVVDLIEGDPILIKNVTVINDSTAKIEGLSYVGALIGGARKAVVIHVENVYIDTKVIATNQAAGGIMGRFNADPGIVLNVNNAVIKGSIQAPKNVGTVLGTGVLNATLNVTNLFASNLIQTSGTNTVKIGAGNVSSAIVTVSSAFYNSETTEFINDVGPVSPIPDATGLTTSEITQIWFDSAEFNGEFFKVENGTIVRNIVIN